MIKDYDETSENLNSQWRSKKLHKGPYRFATENALNRRNTTQAQFEAQIDFDSTSNDHTGNPALVMYKQGEEYVAWYDPKRNGGYLTPLGLKGNKKG
jgi:hypothetical protein